MQAQDKGSFDDPNSGKYYFEKIVETVLSDRNLYNKYGKEIERNLVSAFENYEWLHSLAQDIIEASKNPDNNIRFSGSPSLSSGGATTFQSNYTPDTGIVVLKTQAYIGTLRKTTINGIIKRKLNDRVNRGEEAFEMKKTTIHLVNLNSNKEDIESDNEKSNSESIDADYGQSGESYNGPSVTKKQLSRKTKLTSELNDDESIKEPAKKRARIHLVNLNSNKEDIESDNEKSNSESIDADYSESNERYSDPPRKIKQILRKPNLNIDANDDEDTDAVDKIENMRNFFDDSLKLNKSENKSSSIQKISTMFNKFIAQRNAPEDEDEDFPKTKEETAAFILGLTSLTSVYDNELGHFRTKRQFYFKSEGGKYNEKLCFRRAIYSALMPDFNMQVNWIFAYIDLANHIDNFPHLKRDLNLCTKDYLQHHITDKQVIKYLVNEGNFSNNNITEVKDITPELKEKVKTQQAKIIANIYDLQSSLQAIINVHLIQTKGNKSNVKSSHAMGMACYKKIINKHRKHPAFLKEQKKSAPSNNEKAFKNIQYYLKLLQNQDVSKEAPPSHITSDDLEILKKANFSRDEIQACLALISMRHRNGASSIIGCRLKTHVKSTVGHIIAKEAWYLLLPVEIRNEFLLICSKIIDNNVMLPIRFVTHFHRLIFFPLKRVNGEDKKVIPSELKDFLCNRVDIFKKPFNELDENIKEGIREIQSEFKKHYPRIIEFLDQINNFKTYKECDTVFSTPLTYRSGRKNKGRLTTISQINLFKGNVINVEKIERKPLDHKVMTEAEVLREVNSFVLQTTPCIDNSKKSYYKINGIKEKLGKAQNESKKAELINEIRASLSLTNKTPNEQTLETLEGEIKDRLKQEINDFLKSDVSKEEIMIFAIVLGSIYLPNSQQLNFSHYKIGEGYKLHPLASFSHLLVSRPSIKVNQKLYDRIERCINYLSAIPREYADTIHCLLKHNISKTINNESRANNNKDVMNFLYNAKDGDTRNYKNVKHDLIKIREKLSESTERMLYEILNSIDQLKNISRNGVYMGPTINFVAPEIMSEIQTKNNSESENSNSEIIDASNINEEELYEENDEEPDEEDMEEIEEIEKNDEDPDEEFPTYEDLPEETPNEDPSYVNQTSDPILNSSNGKNHSTNRSPSYLDTLSVQSPLVILNPLEISQDTNSLNTSGEQTSPVQMDIDANREGYHAGDLKDGSKQALYEGILALKSPITINDKLYYFIFATNQIRYDDKTCKFIEVPNFNIYNEKSLEGIYIRKIYKYGRKDKEIYEENIKNKYNEIVKDILNQMNQIIEEKYVPSNLNSIKIYHSDGSLEEITNARSIVTKKYYTNSPYRSLLYFGQVEKFQNADLIKFYTQEILKNYHLNSVFGNKISPAPTDLENNIKGFLWPRDKQISIAGERYQLSPLFFTGRLPRSLSQNIIRRTEYISAFIQDILQDNLPTSKTNYELFIEGGEVGYDPNKKLVFISLSQFCYLNNEFISMVKFNKTNNQWDVITSEKEAERAMIEQFKALKPEYKPVLIKRNLGENTDINNLLYHQDLFFKCVCGKIIVYKPGIDKESLEQIKQLYQPQDIISVSADAFKAMSINCIQVNDKTIYVSNPNTPEDFIDLMNQNGIDVIVSPLNIATGIDTGMNCASASVPSSPSPTQQISFFNTL